MSMLSPEFMRGAIRRPMGPEEKQEMVPEEASNSSDFFIYIHIFMQLGLTERPAKGPQNPSNALVRCLFWDSKPD